MHYNIRNVWKYRGQLSPSPKIPEILQQKESCMKLGLWRDAGSALYQYPYSKSSGSFDLVQA